jgi:hypothetical protein
MTTSATSHPENSMSFFDVLFRKHWSETVTTKPREYGVIEQLSKLALMDGDREFSDRNVYIILTCMINHYSR